MADKDIVKAKRGRKSKKELMASLGVVVDNPTLVSPQLKPEHTEEPIVNQNISLTVEDIEADSTEDIDTEIVEPKQALKKRGRKPKGGKIIQQVIALESQKSDKPNVILHLKCSMKDLQTVTKSGSGSTNIEPYTFNAKNNLCYDIIGGENITKVNTNAMNSINSINSIYNENKSSVNDLYDNNEYEHEETSKEGGIKDIWKKLKQLEHDLHVNNVNNKKSACFWDTCEFDNPPVYIPKHYINGTYNVYGCFCCPECAVAYLMNENIDSSAKFERYHLLNHIYSKIYDYTKNVKPSPNPYYMLDKYYGNLTIQEYRSLLRNERLFLIVDKPLTRILPELHDDNDDFILNNKIIPSNNNYQLKSRMQRKKPSKNSIVNEKFGGTLAVTSNHSQPQPQFQSQYLDEQ
jgi:hypothetical protein